MIDNRKVICACGNLECKIGINFDSEPNVMLMTNKHGDDAVMYLNDENIDDLIEFLKQYKTTNETTTN